MSKIYGIGDEEELAEDLQKELPNKIIEEFEKTKEDILNLGFTGWADKPKLDRKEVLMILDKRISELRRGG